ncbi:hypothetical protein AVEN_90877-1 [Araneus ventricosus]|uniref:Uncharacterized protein n=1 Tax=Araneus ventricosus TaxID=182803 RepID=A0A4Y2P352_ARAVE|nr:hypothetical protein AVEN_90877-1 [Araneus ventricosus]
MVYRNENLDNTSSSSGQDNGQENYKSQNSNQYGLDGLKCALDHFKPITFYAALNDYDRNVELFVLPVSACSRSFEVSSSHEQSSYPFLKIFKVNGSVERSKCFNQ